MAILVFQHHEAEGPGRLGERLRDHGHRLEIVRPDAGQALPVDLDGVDGIVALGGPQNVDEQGEHAWMTAEMNLIRRAHEQGLPVVGICLGMQMLAAALGGKVERMDRAEVGFAEVSSSFAGTTDPLLQGLPWRSVQFHMHSREVTALPGGGTVLASSQGCEIQAFKVGLRHYGFQYHFELTRRDFEAMFQAFGDWLSEQGQQPEALREQLEAHYAMHRHLGDRLCDNITDLLMGLDKRLGGRRGADESWMPN